MFEVGMSALVLKICSEYAKSLGLNFPPCTQQEINAICEWVDKHTIKDMTISQNGYNVTFTFKTENDTTKEFTFTIPTTIDIGELEKVLVGSDSIVVERLEDNSGLKVRIAQSVLNDINNKLAKPANPASDSVVTMAANGTVGTKPLSEIGGGNLYMHRVTFKFDSAANYTLITDIVTGTNDSITVGFLRVYIQGYSVVSFNGSDGLGTVTLNCVPSNVNICGVVANNDRTGTNIVNINTNMMGLIIDSQNAVKL